MTGDSPAPGASIHPTSHLLVQRLLHLAQAGSSPLHVESRLMNNPIQPHYADSGLMPVCYILNQVFHF